MTFEYHSENRARKIPVPWIGSDAPAFATETGLQQYGVPGLIARINEIGTHYWAPAHRVTGTFNYLSSAWKRDTLNLSSPSQIALHPAYQRIIGMGWNAVSMILRDMDENGPNHWFWALKCITGEDPVKPEHRGDVQAMTEDWLNWGISSGNF